MANLLLREYGGSIGVSPEFTIMDRSDSDDAINLLRAQAGLHEKAKRFPKKKTLGEIFSKSVNKMISIEQVLQPESFGFIFLGFYWLLWSWGLNGLSKGLCRMVRGGIGFWEHSQ